MINSKIVRAAVLAGAFMGVTTVSATPTLTTLVNFNLATSGSDPNGNLVFDKTGNLYGAATFGGGGNSIGTVFKLSAGTQTLSVVATFPYANQNPPAPFKPTGSLFVDASGNLYGTAYSSFEFNNDPTGSDGAVFKIAAGTLTTISNFGTSPVQTGAEPGLIPDAAGNFYGTTGAGGTNFLSNNLGDGTLFKLNPGTGVASTIINFNNSNGDAPNGDLIKDAAGNLYGTTQAGGANSAGTVFKVTPGTGAITTLASFNSSNGSVPLAGLISDGLGDLFGTTSRGGASNDGTVFEIAAGTGLLTTLATFSGSNGAMPLGELVMDGTGNLYGTTSQGGANNDGTAFEISAGTLALTTLATFNGTNGSSPDDAITPDPAGNLYGLTLGGGANGRGTLFELSGTGFAVPEPASLSVLAMAVPLLLVRRRVRQV